MLEIVPYQENWRSEFQGIAQTLRIDHIGSTSVPGLPAKDVIDIQITVAALDDEFIAAMSSPGYSQPGGVWRDHPPPTLGGPQTEWEKLYFNPPPGQRRTHMHVRVSGRANQRYPLLFRDYLRSHPATAATHAELKRRLAQHLANPDVYPDVKDPAVDLTYFAAEEWAAVTQWQLGPPDA